MISASSVRSSGYYTKALETENKGQTKEPAESAASADNYYADGKANSKWFGKGSEDIGIEGIAVTAERFEALLAGKIKSEETGEVKDMPRGAFGRCGWDFTISAPKAVSIAALVGGDKRVIEAHNQAVDKAMTYLESYAQTRLRTGGGDPVRETTGNITAAMVQHETSRTNDPQLHTHVVVDNFTRSSDGEWRALETKEIYRQLQNSDQVYKVALTASLRELGYDAKVAWEKNEEGKLTSDIKIGDISKETIEAFSSRSTEMQDYKEALNKRILDKLERGELLNKSETQWQKMNPTEQNQRAVLATREAKNELSNGAAKDKWAAMAVKVGFDAEKFRMDAIRGDKTYASNPEIQNVQKDLGGTKYNPQNQVDSANKSLDFAVKREDQLSKNSERITAQIDKNRSSPGFFKFSGEGRSNVSGALFGNRDVISHNGKHFTLDKSMLSVSGIKNKIADELRSQAREAKNAMRSAQNFSSVKKWNDERLKENRNNENKSENKSESGHAGSLLKAVTWDITKIAGATLGRGVFATAEHIASKALTYRAAGFWDRALAAGRIEKELQRQTDRQAEKIVTQQFKTHEANERVDKANRNIERAKDLDKRFAEIAKDKGMSSKYDRPATPQETKANEQINQKERDAAKVASEIKKTARGDNDRSKPQDDKEGKKGNESNNSMGNYKEEAGAPIPTHMPFGKHEGELISDVPEEYKCWLRSEPGMQNAPTLMAAIGGQIIENDGKNESKNKDESSNKNEASKEGESKNKAEKEANPEKIIAARDAKLAELNQKLDKIREMQANLRDAQKDRIALNDLKHATNNPNLRFAKEEKESGKDSIEKLQGEGKAWSENTDKAELRALELLDKNDQLREQAAKDGKSMEERPHFGGDFRSFADAIANQNKEILDKGADKEQSKESDKGNKEYKEQDKEGGKEPSKEVNKESQEPGKEADKGNKEYKEQDKEQDKEGGKDESKEPSKQVNKESQEPGKESDKGNKEDKESGKEVNKDDKEQETTQEPKLSKETDKDSFECALDELSKPAEQKEEQKEGQGKDKEISPAADKAKEAADKAKEAKEAADKAKEQAASSPSMGM